jgi:hypothetical protein
MSDFESGAFNRALPPLRIVFNYACNLLSNLAPGRITRIRDDTKFRHSWVRVPGRNGKRTVTHHLRRLRQIAHRIHQVRAKRVPRTVEHQILRLALPMLESGESTAQTMRRDRLASEALEPRGEHPEDVQTDSCHQHLPYVRGQRNVPATSLRLRRLPDYQNDIANEIDASPSKARRLTPPRARIEGQEAGIVQGAMVR